MTGHHSVKRGIHMKFLLTFTLALVLAGTTLGMDDDEAQAHVEMFQLFNECRPIAMLVEYSEEGTSDGLTTEVGAILLNRLRAARIFIPWASWLDYYKNVWDVPHVSLLAGMVADVHVIQIKLRKQVLDEQMNKAGSATTWDRVIYGQSDSASFIKQQASEVIDEFISEYLRVNEKACSERWKDE